MVLIPAYTILIKDEDVAASRSSTLHVRYRNQTRLAQAFANETHLAAIAQYALLAALLLTAFLALVLSTVWLVCALRTPPPPRSASAFVSGCPTREQSTPERIIDESPTGPGPLAVPDLSDPRERHGAGYPHGADTDGAFDDAAADTILVASSAASAFTAPDALNSLAPARLEEHVLAQNAQPAAHRRSESSSSTQESANSMPRCFGDRLRAVLTLFENVSS